MLSGLGSTEEKFRKKLEHQRRASEEVLHRAVRKKTGRDYYPRSFPYRVPQERWGDELFFRDLEFENPGLKDNSYYDMKRKSVIEREDPSSKFTFPSISDLLDDTVEAVVVRIPPQHPDHTEIRAMEEIMTPMFFKVAKNDTLPGWKPLQSPFPMNTYMKTEGHPPFEKRIWILKVQGDRTGVYEEKLIDFAILSLDPLVSAYRLDDGWHVLGRPVGIEDAGRSMIPVYPLSIAPFRVPEPNGIRSYVFFGKVPEYVALERLKVMIAVYNMDNEAVLGYMEAMGYTQDEVAGMLDGLKESVSIISEIRRIFKGRRLPKKKRQPPSVDAPAEPKVEHRAEAPSTPVSFSRGAEAHDGGLEIATDVSNFTQTKKNKLLQSIISFAKKLRLRRR
ncbi:hypothetical protein DMB44_05360 [Thermoplasma sp. Kam2015]|nr:hypothetical protein DMB44_05360 [Thermoplasma sp. Kam2015]